MRRITKAVLGGFAGCALILGGMQAASGETLLQQVFPGWLTDLDSGGQVTTGAFDSAKAKLKVTETSDGKTTFSIEVKYVDPDFANRTFGSHLHTDLCDTDKPGATGKHYQHQPGDLRSEVWFNLTPNDEGVAVDTAVVPFVPRDNNGVMSIVIHEDPTDPDTGIAGDKEVCLPLDVSATWVPGTDVEPSPLISTQ